MNSRIKVMDGFNIYHDFNNSIIRLLKDLHLWNEDVGDDGYRMCDYQLYTLYHKQAFIGTQFALLGKSSLRGILHDTDKLVLYGMMSKKDASMYHKAYSRHHYGHCIDEEDLRDCVIDYECARITKADKPLNAYGTIMSHRPHAYQVLKPILQELGIDSDKSESDLDFTEWNSQLTTIVDIEAKVNIMVINLLYEKLSGTQLSVDDIRSALKSYNDLLADPISLLTGKL